MLSSPLGDGSCAPLDIGEHGAQHHIGEMTLQAAQGLEPGLALGGSSRHVCLGARVGPGLDDPSALTHPLVPRIDEELEILGDPGHGDRAEALLAKGHPGDREGVPGIALARPAQVPTLAIREDRGYLDYPLTGGREAAQAMSVLRPHLR